MNYRRMVVLGIGLCVYSAMCIGTESESHKQITNIDNNVDLSLWCPKPIRQAIVEYLILTGSTTDFLRLRMVNRVFNGDVATAVDTLTEEQVQVWHDTIANHAQSVRGEPIDPRRWFLTVGVCCKSFNLVRAHLKYNPDTKYFFSRSVYITGLADFYRADINKEKDCTAKCSSISFIIDYCVSSHDTSMLGEIFYHAGWKAQYDLIKMLIQKRVDPNVTAHQGKTVMHGIVEWENWWGYANNTKEDMIAYLLNNGACINAQDEKGNTPLHLACQLRYGALPIVQFLVEKGADKNLKNIKYLHPYGATPMWNTQVIEYFRGQGNVQPKE